MKKQYEFQASLELLVGGWHLLHGTIQFGNEGAGGAQTVQESLEQVQGLNQELKPLGIGFRVSAHWWHELAVNSKHPIVGGSAHLNKPRCIELPEWIEGAKSGKYPKPGRLIPPGFGTPGADLGAFIHPDPTRRKLCHDMMVYTMEECENTMTALSIDDVNGIYWTGPDGIRWQRLCNGDDPLLGYKCNQKLEEWGLVVGGVGSALKEARERGFTKRAKLLIEGKPAGDPCWIDVFTDDVLCCEGIRQINAIAGGELALWQSELLHTHGSGIPFAEGMRIAIRNKVFGGHIHLNAGPVSIQKYGPMLAKRGGTRLSKFQQATDPDFLPGEGPKEWLRHQTDALMVGARWSALTGKVFRVEFDARFSRYADMMARLKKSAMFTLDGFKEACGKLGCEAKTVTV
ncbi:MAG: hypothetical protein NTZ87_01515 [Candidatus Nomurabacteria bacterium]|nr:hypothetical protein [Candidatus Nomurabacteria bacterium]